MIIEKPRSLRLESQIIDPTTYPGWDDLVCSSPNYSFFHTSSWAKTLCDSFGYSPIYFTVIENNKLRALVPLMEVNSILTCKRGVSLPFTDYCEPIIEKDNDFVHIFNNMIEYGKKRGWKYIELRGGSSLFGVKPSAFSPQSSEAPGPSLEPQTLNLEPVPKVPRSLIFNPESSRPAPCTLHPAPCFSEAYLGHTLDLTKGEKKTFSGFRDSTRRNVKKAKKQGVEVKISQDAEAITEFYRLNCMTRREHGLPPQPYQFFRNVYDHVISKGRGFITLAAYSGQNIAGSIFFHFNRKGIFKYGASDKKFQNLRANNLVMWESIKWLCERGFKGLCFGRTEPENEGLKQFKNGWRPEEYSINYFKYDLKRKVFVSNNKDSERGTRNVFLHRLFQRMPIPVLNLAGRVLYRHMG